MSTRLLPGTVIEKPWMDRPDRAMRAKWLIYLAWVLGMGLAAMSERTIRLPASATRG
jgi:hypothetical protein